ncbi:hypothetical protein AK812_SmicGene36644, partial [Symbiodinium microadriaticum]
MTRDVPAGFRWRALAGLVRARWRLLAKLMGADSTEEDPGDAAPHTPPLPE